MKTHLSRAWKSEGAQLGVKGGTFANICSKHGTFTILKVLCCRESF